MKLSDGCKAIGKTVIDLDVYRQYGINILEIRRDNGSQHRFLRTVSQQVASSETLLEADDVLYVSGDASEIQRLATDFGFTMLDSSYTEAGRVIKKVKTLSRNPMIEVLLLISMI